MTCDLIFWLECPCQRLKQEFYSLKIKQARKRLNRQENSLEQDGATRSLTDKTTALS